MCQSIIYPGRLYFKAGILQEKGITGLEARVKDINLKLEHSFGNLIYCYKRRCLVSRTTALLDYWDVHCAWTGCICVLGESKIQNGLWRRGANFVATIAGAVIPICSCGIVPVLTGMVDSGVPLGPTLAFLIAAPMLNIPTVFMTAGLLGKKMAIARVISVFAIAMSIGLIVSYWQKKKKGLRHLSNFMFNQISQQNCKNLPMI